MGLISYLVLAAEYGGLFNNIVKIFDNILDVRVGRRRNRKNEVLPYISMKGGGQYFPNSGPPKCEEDKCLHGRRPPTTLMYISHTLTSLMVPSFMMSAFLVKYENEADPSSILAAFQMC